VARSIPEAAARNPCAFDERTKLRVDDIRIDSPEPRKGRKTTVGPGDHPLSADDIGKTADPFRNQQRMLDEISRGIDDARHQNLFFGQVRITKYGPLMRMSRIRCFEQQRLRLRPQRRRQNESNRYANAIDLQKYCVTSD